MKKKLIIGTLIIIWQFSTTNAINAIGKGTKESPYKTIEQALSTATNGDTIYITSGKYIPIGNSFEIAKGVTIIGGYNESFTSIEPETTILSADVDGDDVYDEITGQLVDGYIDNRYRVVSILSEATNVFLENLKIQGGYANTQGYTTGGGMMIQGNSAKLKNITITGNFCSEAGGGGIQVRTNLSMENCKLIGNQGAGDGGAMYINGEAIVSVKNTLFQYNKSTSGSAVFLKNAISGYFSGNTLLENQSKAYGTFTVYNTALATNRIVTLVNNTFTNNYVTGEIAGGANRGGSAIYVRIASGGLVNLANNTIIGNSSDARNTDGTVASLLGGAIYARQGSVKLANNVIAGNVSSSDYGDVFKTDGVVNSMKYNLFSTNKSSNITPNMYDMFAGENNDSAIKSLTKVFDVLVMNDKIFGNTEMNGGLTPTIKIVNELIDFNRSTINCVPVDNLGESTLNIDLNNDGTINGNLQTDQRGFERNLSDKACIGAYEIGEFSGLTLVNNDINIIRFLGKQFHVDSEYPFDYTVYDITGKPILHSINQIQSSVITLNNLPSGIYLIKVISENNECVRKIIL